MESMSLLTNEYRVDGASRFIESVSSNQFYFYAGNHLNPNTIAQPYDNPQNIVLDSYYSMIFGKKITESNLQLMVKRYDYVANTVYAQYDHSDPDLLDSNFYVIVHEGSQYDVFKCLDNNQGSPSTIIPSRSYVSTDNDDFYFPNDGYRWKYMYSVDEGTASQFSTTDYFPVFVDPGVRDKAVTGAIDVISVRSTGKGYSNYLNGSFGVGDIRLNGNPLRYGLSVEGTKTTNGFYDACWLYIESGPGAGQYRQINTFVSNNTTNYVTLTEAFDPSDLPENTSSFEIYPSVLISGDGNQTSNAHARAIINPSGNTVDHIEMLDRGVGYRTASATVMYSASVGVSEDAEVYPIYSPTNGHGYNPPSELGGHYVCVGVKFSGTEANTVPVDNDYSQLGILKNPKFNNVGITSNDLNQQFSINELVYKIEPVQLAGYASTVRNANNQLTNQLVIDAVDPSKVVKIGDQLLVSFSDSYQIANVASVNDTSIYLNANATFDTISEYSANVYLANATSSGLVDGFSANNVVLTNCDSDFSVGDMFIGVETGTVGTIDSIMVNGSNKAFNTFLQAYTYIGSMVQGNFVPDELVSQTATAVSSARFHSIADDIDTGTKRIYVTHQLGVFNTSVDDPGLTDEIVGQDSGAIASLTNKYLPDLVFGSGEVIYVENISVITRADEKTEVFKIVLNF